MINRLLKTMKIRAHIVTRRSLALLMGVAITFLLPLKVNAQPEDWTRLPGDLVADIANGRQYNVDIATGAGSSLIVWADERNSPGRASFDGTGSDIYGMRVNSEGTPIDPAPFIIVRQPGQQSMPRVAWNGQNWLVVYGTVGGANSSPLELRRLEAVRVSPGAVVLDAIPIAIPKLRPLGTESRYAHVVASDGANWCIANTDPTYEKAILAITVSSEGKVMGPAKRLRDGVESNVQRLRLKYANGTYLLAFRDSDPILNDLVRAIVFDSSLSSAPPISITVSQGIFGDLAGNQDMFLVLYSGTTHRATARRVSSNGSLIDGQAIELDTINTTTRMRAAFDGTNFVVYWQSDQPRRTRLTGTGVNLDPGGVALTSLTLAGSDANVGLVVATPSHQVVLSEVQAGLEGHFRMQVVTSGGLVGPLQPLPSSGRQHFASFAARSDVVALVAYTSTSEFETKHYVQRFDLLGRSLGMPIEYSEGRVLGLHYQSGVFLLVWRGQNGVMGRRFDQSGSPLDLNPFLIRSDSGNVFDIASFGSHFLVLCAVSGPMAQSNLEGVRVGTNGVILGSTIIFDASYTKAACASALGDQWVVAATRTLGQNSTETQSSLFYIAQNGSIVNMRSLPVYGHPSFDRFDSMDMASNGQSALLVRSVRTQGLNDGSDVVVQVVGSEGPIGNATNITPWPLDQFESTVAWFNGLYVVSFVDRNARYSRSFSPPTAFDFTTKVSLMRVSEGGVPLDSQAFALSPRTSSEHSITMAPLPNGLLVAACLFDDEVPFQNMRVMSRVIGKNQNQWPVATGTTTFTDGPAPLTIDFSSAGSYDPDGRIAEYRWEFGNGRHQLGADARFTYETPGLYTAKLIVTDDDGESTVQLFPVFVRRQNIPPVPIATSTPQSGTGPLSVTLSAADSYDLDGFIDEYMWRFPDGTTATGQSANFTFQNEGLFEVVLEVKDDWGVKRTSSITVYVGEANLAPTAAMSATPATGTARLNVQFSSAGSSDPDGIIVARRWEFGDGGTSTLANPAWVYLTPGDFTAKLTVRDDKGATASATQLIAIRGIARATSVWMSSRGRNPNSQVSATVTLRTPDGDPIRDAEVSATWTLPRGTRTQKVRTDVNGIARFNVSGSRGTYTATVTSIVKPFYTFDSANSVVSGSITVPR